MTFIRRYFAVTWSARTWREIAYLLLGLFIATVWFAYMLVMYKVGIALVVIWIGVAVLGFAQWTLRPIGEFERKTANTLLCAGITTPPARGYRLREPGKRLSVAGMGRWWRALLHDGHSWRVLAWLSMRLVLAPVGFVLALCAVVVPVVLIATWVFSAIYALGWAGDVVSGPDADTARQVLDRIAYLMLVGTPLVAALVPVFAWISHHYATLLAGLARWTLGQSPDEMLAQATARAELAETQVRVDQELHDSIGHMITMNIVQAGAGAHVFDGDPEFARQALRNIEERGRVAMGELDRIIAAIGGDDGEPRTPLPTMAEVPALVEQARSAGLVVDARLEAEPAPAALSRAAYAIVREAVTNAAKHAPGSAIHLHLTTLDDALAVMVRNGAPAPGTAPVAALRESRSSTARGVAGIRDRAALLGGSSVIGPSEDGGFEVMVLLPLAMALESEVSDQVSAAPGCCEWSRARAKVAT